MRCPEPYKDFLKTFLIAYLNENISQIVLKIADLQAHNTQTHFMGTRKTFMGPIWMTRPIITPTIKYFEVKMLIVWSKYAMKILD